MGRDLVARRLRLTVRVASWVTQLGISKSVSPIRGLERKSSKRSSAGGWAVLVTFTPSSLRVKAAAVQQVPETKGVTTLQYAGALQRNR